MRHIKTNVQVFSFEMSLSSFFFLLPFSFPFSLCGVIFFLFLFSWMFGRLEATLFPFFYREYFIFKLFVRFYTLDFDGINNNSISKLWTVLLKKKSKNKQITCFRIKSQVCVVHYYQVK